MKTVKEYIVWSANRDSEHECVRIKVTAELTHDGNAIDISVEADKVEECTDISDGFIPAAKWSPND